VHKERNINPSYGLKKNSHDIDYYDEWHALQC